MGDKINLTLDIRTAQGKKVARLRKEGLVPAVVYGHGLEPILGQSEYNVMEKVIRDAGKHTPVHLTVAGKKRIALIKDIDRDSVKQRIRHVAFHAVKADDFVVTEVPIRLIGLGESEAEKTGLIILQALESVEVRAKPADLPDSIEISVVNLTTDDDKITLADVNLPSDVEFADAVQDLELVIANVYEPAALEAANEAAAGDSDESSEPEIEGETETQAQAENSAEDKSE